VLDSCINGQRIDSWSGLDFISIIVLNALSIVIIVVTFSY
jgi:hypothetical protein